MVTLGHGKRAESRLVPRKQGGGDALIQQLGLIAQAAFLKAVSFGSDDYFRIVAAVCVIYHEKMKPFPIRTHQRGITEGSQSWVLFFNESC